MGPRGFKSRSMQSFQEALERGEAEHLMPMFDAKKKMAKGQISKEDIPYMQRGGPWDNTDVKGAKNRKRWLNSDKKYNDGGFRKEQLISIFGYGDGLDWTGTRKKSGPEGVMAGKAKMPKVRSLLLFCETTAYNCTGALVFSLASLFSPCCKVTSRQRSRLIKKEVKKDDEGKGKKKRGWFGF